MKRLVTVERKDKMLLFLSNAVDMTFIIGLCNYFTTKHTSQQEI